jgi:signal transduction histidine kinase
MDTSLHINELKSLIEVSRTVNAQLDLNAVLEAVMVVTTRLMRVEASSLVLTEEGTGDLLFHVTKGTKAGEVKLIRMKPGEGVIGHVIKTGKATIVNDTASDDRFECGIDERTGFVTKSILCVPLSTPNKHWGAIEVLNKIGGVPFNEHDMVLCEAVASQAAIAIENAMLHRRVVNNERLASVGQTVAGMAHCVKNVLNGLRAGSYIIDKGLRKHEVGKVSRGWEIVKKNNEFVENLVLDMLTYSKDRKPDYETADVNEVVRSVYDLMAPKAEEEGVSLQWEPDAGIGPVSIDPQGIKRCVLNLVSNAMDACAGNDAAQVQIATERHGEHAFKIRVRDNGRGIDSRDTAKLFRVFFSTKGSKGTGFGLAVTNKIVMEHKGRIDVESSPGAGATFTIVLPMNGEREQGGEESQKRL